MRFYFWAFIAAAVILPSPVSAGSTINGDLRIIAVDSAAHSAQLYYLKTAGRSVPLTLGPYAERQVASGEIRAGDNVDAEVRSAHDEKVYVDKFGLRSRKTARVQSAGSPPRKIAFLLLSFSDQPIGLTADDVDLVFNRAMYPVSKVFEINSFGSVRFSNDADGDGEPDVYGPFTLSGLASEPAPLEFLDPWSVEALALATASGFQEQLYDHIALVFPDSSPWPHPLGGAAPAFGEMNGKLSWYHTLDGQIIAHELGHNLGLEHSKSDENNDGVVDYEYGDNTCIMGTNYDSLQFNAYAREQLGWYAAKNQFALELALPPVNRRVVLSAFQLEPAAAAHFQMVRLKIGRQNYRDYIIS